MAIRRLAVVVLLLAIPSFAWATVIEDSKMAEIVPHADSSTLLIFDLDSTILEPVQMLGNDAWFKDLLEQKVKAGMTEDAARDEVTAIYTWVQEVTAVRAVEAETPALIREAQARGVTVIGLTARPLEVSDATARQLASIGVDFTLRPIFRGTVSSAGSGWRYAGGILFVGVRGKKGPALEEFLRRIKFTPSRVVFVDDKKSNVESVDAVLATRGVDCRCVRYGADDDQAKRLDPAVAAVELEYFGKVLSDQAAGAILKGRRR